MLYQEVIGQKYALTMLKSSLSKDRLPGAYLFYGPPGVGKNKTAKLLAKAICCLNQDQEKPSPLDVCNQCPSCIRIEQGLHPDVQEIVPDGDFLKIGQIRELQNKLHFRPFEATKKIFVLDQVEKMGHEAANCFLKSLEEPPPYVIFILIANSIASLLPTIISRAQPVRFALLPDRSVLEILQQWELDTEKAKRLTFWAEGSPGKAKEYLEAGIFEEEEKILKWLNKFKKDGLIQAFKIAEQLKEKPDISLDILSFWVRNGLWHLPSPFTHTKLSPGKLLALIELIGQTRNQIALRANVQLALEVLLIKLKPFLVP